MITDATGKKQIVSFRSDSHGTWKAQTLVKNITVHKNNGISGKKRNSG